MQSVGKYTYGHEGIRVHFTDSGKHLTIGSFCSFAAGIQIYLGGNHTIDWITTYPFGHIHRGIFNSQNFDRNRHPTTNGDVVIGNDVWIGNNVTIMSGVKIGDGAVIACNSHVVKDVEPYTIVGGNPARFIRHRFTPEQTEKLLEIKWWDWPDEKINRYLPLLCSGNISDFIREASIPDTVMNIKPFSMVYKAIYTSEDLK